jgi:hypothetical protein
MSLAACGGSKPTEPAQTTTSVSITPGNQTLAVGGTVTLSATPRDVSGASIAGRSVVWSSSNGIVASVQAASGVVTALSPGIAVIRATIDQKFDEILVEVMAPVASVQITARRTAVGVNASLQLTATTRDANNITLMGRVVMWSSSDETKARVSSSGLVSGVAAGTATITATSEGVRETLTLSVVDVQPLQISEISPATLGPGVVATITGANFDANAVDIDVTVAGLPVAITAATATQLTVQLPAFVPCQPTQGVPVTVSGVAGTATRAHPLHVARQRSIAVGELLVLSGVEARCNELPSVPARYALAVVNTSRAPSATAAFELRGLGPTASPSAAPAPAALATWATAGGSSMGLISPSRRALAALHRREHLVWLERERALVHQLGGSPRRALRAAASGSLASQVRTASAASQRMSAPVPLEVGAKTTLRFRTSDLNCTDSKAVEARVVYVGPTSVILESTDAPLAGTMDADYVALGTEYDNTMHNVLVQHFGNPLAYDDSTDANGRIVMLFAKAVNDRAANLLGFVTACDFFKPTVSGASASNQAEIFYARVPSSNDENIRNINTRVGWKHIMRGTLIHEAKHIVSYAERFQAPIDAELEESWLEEATAQAAVELWGRATYYAGKAEWKGNATYRNTMYCDFGIVGRDCADQPLIIGDHFVFLFGYYENINTKAYFSAARDDTDVYGSGWLFARWAADHHAADEAAFFRSVTQSYTQTGLANIEARIGRDYESFHPEFMMSLYADDVSGLGPAAGARYTVPSWNLRDMFLGLSGDFTRNGEQLPPFPLRRRIATFGAFNADVSALLGGAAAYVELSGAPTSPQVIDLRAPGAQPLPAGTPLKLAILRVE